MNIYENGKKMFVLLPLDKYRITDERLVELENVNRHSEKYSMLPIIGTTKDNDDIIISTLFNSVINPSLGYTIGYKNYPQNASFIRIKTSEHSPWYVGRKINVHLYLKSRTDGSLYAFHYFDQPCWDSQAYAIAGEKCHRLMFLFWQ